MKYLTLTLAMLVICCGAGCANRHGSVTRLEIQGDNDWRFFKVKATGDVVIDPDNRVFLNINVKNKSNVFLLFSFSEKYDGLNFDLERLIKGNISSYQKVDQRFKEPLFPASSWTQSLSPSMTRSWKVPLQDFYDLPAGEYRVFVTIKFALGFRKTFMPQSPADWGDMDGKSVPTSMVVGPIKFMVGTNAAAGGMTNQK